MLATSFRANTVTIQLYCEVDLDVEGACIYSCRRVCLDFCIVRAT